MKCLQSTPAINYYGGREARARMIGILKGAMTRPPTRKYKRATISITLSFNSPGGGVVSKRMRFYCDAGNLRDSWHRYSSA